jgi:3-oxoacyl-[acyl-carrier-protein] synthase-1
MRKVCVTGLGFATCLGLEADEVADNLRTLRHGIRPYSEGFAGETPIGVAAPVPGFTTEGEDPEDWTYPDSLRFRIDQLRCLSPNVLYAAYALEKAVADASLSREELSDPMTGMFTASAGSAKMHLFHLNHLKRHGPSRSKPMGMISSIAGTLNFNLVARYRIQGASTGFVSACASSAHALGMAYDEIALGRQDRMLVVGAEDFTPETVLPFAGMRVLSLNKDPNTASRPFDKNRDGFVATGGAVVMILEAEEVARKRDAQIKARVLGWGQSTDGHHVAIPHPEGHGLARAMTQALRSTETPPESINYINAHATSTPMGDAVECKAIKSVFGRRGDLAISSTKALTGHALSLAGVMEGAFVSLGMERGFTPGAAHIEERDEEAEGLFLPAKTLDEAPTLVLSNSSGFGGANVSILFGAGN